MGHSGAAEIRILSYLKQLKKQTKHMKEWFSDRTTSNTGHKPQRSKTNEVTSLMIPVDCLERVSQATAKGRGTQTKLGCLRWAEETEFIFGEAKMGQSTREEKAACRGESCAARDHGPRKDANRMNLQLSAAKNLHVRPEKEPLERSRWNKPYSSHSTGNSPVPTSREEKPGNKQEIG